MVVVKSLLCAHMFAHVTREPVRSVHSVASNRSDTPEWTSGSGARSSLKAVDGVGFNACPCSNTGAPWGLGGMPRRAGLGAHVLSASWKRCPRLQLLPMPSSSSSDEWSGSSASRCSPVLLPLLRFLLNGAAGCECSTVPERNLRGELSDLAPIVTSPSNKSAAAGAGMVRRGSARLCPAEREEREEARKLLGRGLIFATSLEPQPRPGRDEPLPTFFWEPDSALGQNE